MCFALITVLVCADGLTGERQRRVVKFFYDTPNLVDLIFLIILIFPAFIGYAIVYMFDKYLYLNQWSTRLFIGFSHFLGAYACYFIRKANYRSESSFLQSLFFAWKEWGNESITNIQILLILLAYWLLGIAWISLANVLFHPRRTWYRINSWINNIPSRPQVSMYREYPQDISQYGFVAPVEENPNLSTMVPVSTFLGYWNERAYLLKRTLWWAGLVLLLPAPVSLLFRRAVYRFFTLLSAQALGSDSPDVEVLVLERVLISVSLGILCWILCAVLDVFLRLRPENTTPPYPAKSTDRQVAVTAVSTVLVISACLVALLCLTGISLHGTLAVS